ncbi:MAG: hypothetical protein KJ592_04050 [Nanoarchaeota archaeon]|nr:hypothetical protein [Nanoarchaeota archaeon]
MERFGNYHAMSGGVKAEMTLRKDKVLSQDFFYSTTRFYTETDISGSQGKHSVKYKFTNPSIDRHFDRLIKMSSGIEAALVDPAISNWDWKGARDVARCIVRIEDQVRKDINKK